MKKLILYSITALLSLAFIPNGAQATMGARNTEAPADTSGQTNRLTRLAEIKTMDKSMLNHDEKKALRSEKRDIKEANHIGGGAYISLGALIIIILLLILIL